MAATVTLTKEEADKKIENITKQFKKLEKSKTDARGFLDKVLEKEQDEKILKKIKELRTPDVIKGDPAQEYFLDYDAFGEGLEPAYYWLLDELKENISFSYKVKKSYDYFAASEGSYWYGDVGVRRSALEKRATELLGTISVVIKSVINLIWDLKEFEQRFEHYDNFKSSDKSKKEAGEFALKSIWLTDVDTKKGRAAINVLTNDLNFITLRDAFMSAKNLGEVEKLEINDRVKRILKPRVQEFLKWIDLSDRELRQRFKIEKTYLKSQVNALELYTRWVKPYLIATNKLLPEEAPEEPEELVTAFDVARVVIEIFGTKEQKLNISGRIPVPIELPEDEKIFKCIEIKFVYRAIPGSVERGHFVHRGRVKIYFRAYILNKKQIDEFQKAQEEEIMKFVSGMTKESLDALYDDLKHFDAVGGEEKKEEQQKEKKKTPAFEFVKSAKELIEPITKAAENIKQILPKRKGFDVYALERIKKAASGSVKKDLFALYDLYKKAHKMLSW
ncbi:MAG: hypothetical protein HYT16_02685 [DPANN group archaeon]|nr:hypothetical protein [DPANN group archaeon]